MIPIRGWDHAKFGDTVLIASYRLGKGLSQFLYLFLPIAWLRRSGFYLVSFPLAESFDDFSF